MPPAGELLEVVHGRHNEMIDPSMHIWGWEIPVYLFLGGLAAGLLVLPAALELVRGDRAVPRSIRLMPFVSIALITLGMVALFLDLEFKSHVYRFYLALKPLSPMSWGSWILLLVYPIAALVGIGLLTEGERAALARGLPGFGGAVRWAAGRYEANPRAVLGTAILVGAALGAYTGLLLGTLGARPLWNSPILGPLFLASGVSTAAALMLLLRPTGFVHSTLSAWEKVLIPVEISLVALMLLGFVTGGRAAQVAAQQLLGGPWTGLFWSLVLGVGLLVPWAMNLAEAKLHLKPTIAAPALVLIGGFSLRWILVAAGQASSFGIVP